MWLALCDVVWCNSPLDSGKYGVARCVQFLPNLTCGRLRSTKFAYAAATTTMKHVQAHSFLGNTLWLLRGTVEWMDNAQCNAVHVTRRMFKFNHTNIIAKQAMIRTLATTSGCCVRSSICSSGPSTTYDSPHSESLYTSASGCHSIFPINRAPC